MSVLLWWIPVSWAGLNTWGAQTEGGTVAMAPYIYVGPAWSSTTLGGSLGLGSRMDLYLGAYLATDAGTPSGGLDLMGRFFLNPAVCGVIHATGNPNQLALGPEIHLNVSAVTANVGWSPNLAPGGGDPGLLWGYFAADFAPWERVGLFIEVDPYVDLVTPGWSVDAVPGLSVTLGEVSLALGVGVPVLPEPAAPYVGTWIWRSFSLRPQSPNPSAP